MTTEINLAMWAIKFCNIPELVTGIAVGMLLPQYLYFLYINKKIRVFRLMKRVHFKHVL